MIATILVRLRLTYEALESLIQTVAHDLKSPVISVVGLVRALRGRCRNLPSDDRRDAILDQLENSGERMERFLKELLEDLAADSMSLLLGDVRVDQIVHDSVSQHQQTIEEKGIKLKLEIEPDLGPVWGDSHRIRQVIDNILLNAVRHMGNGPEPMIKIQVRNEQTSIITSISDNGIGIPAEHLGKIFDRFFRVPTSDGKTGTGLGLSIAKKIMDSHGGRIWAESKDGRGATFAFALPKSKRE